ncbi:MAG: HNH endonuclease [Chloroflexota bacterium]
MQDKVARPTPEPIARQLRQESAFGCCRCGHPIIQYHHIIPYADDHHFRPKDMMALCPNCHDAANNGAITLDEQRRFKSKPYNVKRGYATGFLTIHNKPLQLNMGSNIFIGGGIIIQADKTSLVTLNLNERSRIELTIKLYDQQNNLILAIDKNEWVSGDPTPWDIDASYQKLKIRKKKGLVALDLNLQQMHVYIKANLWWKGHLILISPSTLRMDRNELDCQFVRCTFNKCCLSFRTTPKPAVEIIPNLVR